MIDVVSFQLINFYSKIIGNLIFMPDKVIKIALSIFHGTYKMRINIRHSCIDQK